MKLEESLLKVFCSNFVVYYKSHSSHMNITGRYFYSDHKLLEKIYDDLQDEIDTIGELLRTIQVEVPYSLNEILDLSEINDYNPSTSADDLLSVVYDDLEALIKVYEDFETIANLDIDHSDLSNYAQDQIRVLHKHCWKLRATLDGRV